MSTPPSPNDLTRQQLDELDALLQRMLSLPLSAPPAAAPTPVPVPVPEPRPAPSAVSGTWRADASPSGARVPYLTGDPAAARPELVQLTAPAPPPTWGPDPLSRPAGPVDPRRLFGPPTPETGTPPSTGTSYEYSLPVPGTVRGVDAPALPAGFRADDPEAVVAPEPPVAPSPATPLHPAPDSSPITHHPSLPVSLWPLFGVNWLLEAVLGLLGPVGAVLTHPAMKHLLGAAGVLLMAAAGAWAARGMGWVELPWPK